MKKPSLALEMALRVAWEFGYACGCVHKYGRLSHPGTHFGFRIPLLRGFLQDFIGRLPQAQRLEVGAKIKRAIACAKGVPA